MGHVPLGERRCSFAYSKAASALCQRLAAQFGTYTKGCFSAKYSFVQNKRNEDFYAKML
jgi:hypothetical protein